MYETEKMLTFRGEFSFKWIIPQLELKSLMKPFGNKWQPFVCWSLVCFHCRRGPVVIVANLTLTPASTFQCYQPLITNCNRIPVLWGGFRFAPPFYVLHFRCHVITKIFALLYFHENWKYNTVIRIRLLITTTTEKQRKWHIVKVCTH